MAPVSGWYTDTKNPHNLRWFDGADWTDHVKSRSEPDRTPPDGFETKTVSSVLLDKQDKSVDRGSMPTKKKIFLGIGLWLAAFLFGVLVSFALTYDPATSSQHEYIYENPYKNQSYVVEEPKTPHIPTPTPTSLKLLLGIEDE